MCFGPIADPILNSDRSKVITQEMDGHEMNFDILFEDENVSSDNVPQQQRAEYRTFMYLRSLRRMRSVEDPCQRMVLDLAQAVTHSSSCSDSRLELLDTLLHEIKAQGFDASIVKCHGSSNAPGILKFRSSFLQLTVDQQCSASSTTCSFRQTFIVEPRLQDEFQIVRPTPEYSRLLEDVPHVFVGTSSQLARIVAFMSERMQESFRQRGMCSPPWRQVSNLLRKWNLRQTLEPCNDSSGRAASKLLQCGLQTKLCSGQALKHILTNTDNARGQQESLAHSGIVKSGVAGDAAYRKLMPYSHLHPDTESKYKKRGSCSSTITARAQ
mmetsp:Transcript_30632/g.59054  ORF Transcript_30632/g.59054 Transcript_30632/m.59054 type:complete len:326 (+) Transcript_30632:225-1202(+)|eukprot:CAMPEP_0114247614 /NCGR_PEP_ID=MMETSP0058-20121206/13118_1 /TAXON_ID=36894 /ORGANISM="Pyramimonas parkeae, CCMP726" /LENGTH=325 /DNA_ID=CAMNT_0001360935 /DNA_START=203 /DNA_END=1180 /DNA_ORIENTATION=-